MSPNNVKKYIYHPAHKMPSRKKYVYQNFVNHHDNAAN